MHSKIPMSVRKGPVSTWTPPHAAVCIDDLTITGGLIYAGTQVEGVEQGLIHEPSFVNVDLPRSGGLPTSSQALSYAAFHPRQRGRYVEWLANGQPETRESFITVFVCGIERRWITEREQISDSELGCIKSRLQRLATHSHGAAASHLLGLIRAQQHWAAPTAAPLAMYEPTFPNFDPCFTLSVLRDCAQRRTPLPPHWAVAALLCRAEPLGELLDLSLLEEVRALFAVRYADHFGAGITPEMTGDDTRLYVCKSPLIRPRVLPVPAVSSASDSLGLQWLGLERLARAALADLKMYRYCVAGVSTVEKRVRTAGGLLHQDVMSQYSALLSDPLLDHLTGRGDKGPTVLDDVAMSKVWPTHRIGLTSFTMVRLLAVLISRGYSVEPNPDYMTWDGPLSRVAIFEAPPASEDVVKRAAVLTLHHRMATNSHGLQAALDRLSLEVDISPELDPHVAALSMVLSALSRKDQSALRLRRPLTPTQRHVVSKAVDLAAQSVTPSPRERLPSRSLIPLVDLATTHRPASSDALLPINIHDAEVESILQRLQRNTVLPPRQLVTVVSDVLSANREGKE
jgi:hypothetical protein